MFSALLDSRSLIRIHGVDTTRFLQGLISNDVRLLEQGKAIYAALLSPQGKFQHDFFLVPYGEAIYLDVSASRADDLFGKLNIYKLRSAVEIEKVSDLRVAAFWGEEMVTGGRVYADPRLPEMGYRALVGDEKIAGDDYEMHRLLLGVPDTADMVEGRSLLLECDFEALHGVDFNKGCYVGQEVTARSKFRGQVRKNFYKVTAENMLPPLGELICAGGKNIGEMRTSAGGIGIAIVYNDEYKYAKDNNIDCICAGNKIELHRMNWAKKNN